MPSRRTPSFRGAALWLWELLFGQMVSLGGPPVSAGISYEAAEGKTSYRQAKGRVAEARGRPRGRKAGP